MIDKIVKLMAVIGALSMAVLLIGAASITLINNNVNITGDLVVSGKINVGGVDYAHVPVGTIVAYWGTTPPNGWLLCDGASIPSGAAYSALRTLCGSTVPDLRGTFLRGLDLGRGLDPEIRTLGSFQEDAFETHTHTYTYYPRSGLSYQDHINDWDNTVSDALSTYTTSLPTGRTSSETRPKNVAVPYIIKY